MILHQKDDYYLPCYLLKKSKNFEIFDLIKLIIDLLSQKDSIIRYR